MSRYDKDSFWKALLVFLAIYGLACLIRPVIVAALGYWGIEP